MEQNTFIWYRKAKDFKLLMDLLAEQAGLAHSFRILAVFDKHFQRLWRARDMKIIIQRSNPQSIAAPPSDEKEKEKDKDGKDTDKDKSESAVNNYPASLWVLWNDADIAFYMNRKVKRSLFEYTVEINPPTEAPIKSFFYHTIPDFGRFSPMNLPGIEPEKSTRTGKYNNILREHS